MHEAAPYSSSIILSLSSLLMAPPVPNTGVPLMARPVSNTGFPLMARPVPNTGYGNRMQSEQTISVDTGERSENFRNRTPPLSTANVSSSEDGMVHVQYKLEEKILHLKHRLQMLKGYPVEKQQLCFSGVVIGDTRFIRDFALGIVRLCLDPAPPATGSQNQSRHSYTNFQTEGAARQYVGNIGSPQSGYSFGSHKYFDIKAKDNSKQVLGDMLDFPPGL